MSHQGLQVPSRGGSGVRFLENLAYLVPGYRGYKDKELRREEDSRLRGRVLAKLRLIRSLLTEMLTHADEPMPEALTAEMERRLRRVEALAEAVRYAPYGFTGFFDVDRVGEDTLEKVLEIDLLLFQDLDDTAYLIHRSTLTLGAREDQQVFFGSLDSALDQVETRLVTRDKILGDR